MAPRQKLKVRDLYSLVEECVRDGLEGGWHKAHKHDDRPRSEAVWERQLEYIMLSISERFDLTWEGKN